MIELLFMLAIIGVVLYLINTLPIDGTIKVIIHVVVVLFAVLFLLQLAGISTGGLPRVYHR